MGEMAYRHLFPYEKILPKSKILIYGAGALGQEYYTQLSITHYCEVMGFIDRNYENYQGCVVPVYPPDRIADMEADYVVVALRMEAAFQEIKRILLQANVPEDRIVAVFERKYDAHIMFDAADRFDAEFAYKENVKSIALLTTGGFGDMVIQKRLVMELIRLAPGCSIDLYNVKAFEFLKNLYTDMPDVKNVIPDLGSRYYKRVKKYSLGLTIEACHFIKVDYFKEEIWDRENQAFSRKIKLLMERVGEEKAGISTPAHVTMYRRRYKGENAYTGFNYDGVFEISDKRVNIPLDNGAGKRFAQMGLSGYITINCGNGDCADGRMVAKSWPLGYYEELVKLIKQNAPHISVVQLGGKEAIKIKGCDSYMFGEDFTLVTHILKNSMLHIDIEGGLVHIATQLETKCIVLFGPTVEEYYGYESNINIRAGNCHNCWGLYEDVNKCARGMEQPACMYAITPEMVYSQASGELSKWMDKAFKR